MRTGRPPKPDWLKEIAGNPGKRKLRAPGPAFERPATPPPAPRHLSKLARAWWEESVPVLHREGKLATLGLRSLEMAAEAYATWRTYEAEAAQLGPLAAVKSKVRAAADKASDRYLQTMARFGGDPQAHGMLKGFPAPADAADDAAKGRRARFFAAPGPRPTPPPA